MNSKIFNTLYKIEDINHLYTNMANLEKLINDIKPNYELDVNNLNNYKQLLLNINIFHVKYVSQGLNWDFIKLWQSIHDGIINNLNMNSKIMIGLIDNIIHIKLNELDCYLFKNPLKTKIRRIPSRVTIYSNPDYVEIKCCTII